MPLALYPAYPIEPNRQRTAKGRSLHRRPKRRVVAIDVNPRPGEKVSLLGAHSQGKRSLVAGTHCCGLDSSVVFSVGVREEAAGSAELVLAPRPRLAQLTLELSSAELGKMRVSGGVRADLEAELGSAAKLLPGHRREVLRMRSEVVLKLRDVETAPVHREVGDREDRGGHPETFEHRQGVDADVSVSVVERYVNKATAASQRLGGGNEAKAPTVQPPQLALERACADCEHILPFVGDGVVAEDEGL